MSKPLSILLINQTWFAEELSELGHRVVTIGIDDRKFDIKISFPGFHISKLQDVLPRGFRPDCIVYFDNSGPVTVLGMEDVEVPTLFYSVDTHHHLSWHKCYSAIYDMTLVAQRGYVEPMQKYSGNCEWFPLWASVNVEPSEQKTIDVCFRGNLDPNFHPERAMFFDNLSSALQGHVEVDFKRGRFVDDYSKSKIVVNQSVKDDLNFRVFESMMCGAALVTPSNSMGLFEIFQDGVDLVTYEHNDAKDAARKVRYLLENEDLRENIANSGREKVLQNHSLMARAEQLQTILSELQVTPRPHKYFGAAVAHYMASRRIRQLSDPIADKMLELTVSLVHKSMDRGEVVDDGLTTLIHYCKYDCERRGINELAVSLLKKALSIYPENNVFLPSYVESLKKVASAEEAIEAISSMSNDPVSLVGHAEHVMSSLRNHVLAELDKDKDKPLWTTD